MSSERGISEIFGEGVDSSGRSVPIYRALRSLLCSACGTPMPAGSLFTRKSIPQFALRILPRCQRCAPFETRADTSEPEESEQPEKSEKTEQPEDTEQPKSQLMSHLLSAPEATEETQTEPRLDIEEEVAKRLGPALSRSRQRRS